VFVHTSILFLTAGLVLGASPLRGNALAIDIRVRAVRITAFAFVMALISVKAGAILSHAGEKVASVQSFTVVGGHSRTIGTALGKHGPITVVRGCIAILLLVVVAVWVTTSALIRVPHATRRVARVLISVLAVIHFAAAAHPLLIVTRQTGSECGIFAIALTVMVVAFVVPAIGGTADLRQNSALTAIVLARIGCQNGYHFLVIETVIIGGISVAKLFHGIHTARGQITQSLVAAIVSAGCVGAGEWTIPAFALPSPTVSLTAVSARGRVSPPVLKTSCSNGVRFLPMTAVKSVTGSLVSSNAVDVDTVHPVTAFHPSAVGFVLRVPAIGPAGVGWVPRAIRVGLTPALILIVSTAIGIEASVVSESAAVVGFAC